MNLKKIIVTGLLTLAATSMALAAPAPLSPLEQLGKNLFFDTALSSPPGQSCASCHAPEVGFTGPDSAINASGAVYPGAVPDRFGNRRPPTAAYAGESPLLHYDASKGWVGGMFWDGRATGARLDDPLAEQAQGPFLNPLEHNLPDAGQLCVEVAASTYAPLFEEVWGSGSLDCGNAAESYERIARSIAAYERSVEVSPFNSKFDLFWDRAKRSGKDVTKIRVGSSSTDPYRWQAYRRLGLTDSELLGLAIFNDRNRANCASCHSLAPGAAGYPLFTDYGYDNLGLPKNPDNPFYTMPAEWNPDGENWLDYGLGGYLKAAGEGPEVYGPQLGKFKVPTLRNVDLRPSTSMVKAYGHNGYFKSLPDILRFYAQRGMGGGMGGGGMGGGGMGGGGMMVPAPEVNQNLATLKMFSMMDQSYVLAFLKTLSDGYFMR